ncbi:phosphonoacetate hydrolase [Acidiphilium sp. AL]|uniref:Phosphonoacetate hydrolase n=1 Tax=Acidiphilium iwatense TaxID=768198 RepID=A0ABS9E3P9_9PROT|nr:MULTISPECIES: phosphonoacetate hydrolase [Acidiphilium]MCF3948209.1 phosphonoacetate hydrolase [Acidiphilium iwatense]MCU4161674.1 phosphonoacetate hydrolase [Acidiphilium sp. AL]
MTTHRSFHTVDANGRIYRIPATPTVAVCIDGSEPGYIEAAIAAGLAPNLDRIMRTGTSTTAKSVIPSFTNPNNISIITGRPPSVHGIAGNYFLDPATGQEVMMNDAKFMRAGTIMKALQDGGARVAVVTAKDKLRTLLGHGLDCSAGRAVAFSSEKADKVSLAENGIADALGLVGMKLPEVYSAELSEFVFAAGVRLLETMRPDAMYLSTTDYIQHRAAPGSAVANRFYAMLDGYVGRLDAAGAVVALTADHGMNDKYLPDGAPDVIYLQDQFNAWTAKGICRVILPITDPYVAHHGALGSFATVYLPPGTDAAALLSRLRALDGVDLAIGRDEACRRFELPEDRIGDIVVISARHKVLGTSRDRHDLSGLTEPLRSHGGLTEQTVPMIVNRKIAFRPDHELRNFDVFDVALNLVQ